MSKITNGKNVENFEKREKLRIAIIITSLITIILHKGILFMYQFSNKKIRPIHNGLILLSSNMP